MVFLMAKDHRLRPKSVTPLLGPLYRAKGWSDKPPIPSV
jgi:hypothetical protein